MNIEDAFPSKYIKASDLKGQAVRVTIEDVRLEEVGQGEEQETKPVIYFVGKVKGMVLNVTNSRLIASKLGGETDGWKGKEIELYPTDVTFQGKVVEAVRVRHPIPPAAVTGSPAEPPF